MRHNQRNAGCRRRSMNTAAGISAGAEGTVGAVSEKATGGERLRIGRCQSLQRLDALNRRQRCVAVQANLAQGY